MTKQVNIKNRTDYFYNDLINIADFVKRFLKLDKKHQLGLIFITLVILQKNHSGMLIV